MILPQIASHELYIKPIDLASPHDCQVKSLFQWIKNQKRIFHAGGQNQRIALGVPPQGDFPRLGGSPGSKDCRGPIPKAMA